VTLGKARTGRWIIGSSEQQNRDVDDRHANRDHAKAQAYRGEGKAVVVEGRSARSLPFS
jgi:hypothetical protein